MGIDRFIFVSIIKQWAIRLRARPYAVGRIQMEMQQGSRSRRVTSNITRLLAEAALAR